MGITERKEKEKNLMRMRILDAARKLFVEYGFSKVTLRRIAEEIEYHPSTIYLYFKNKDDILLSLHEEGLEKLYELLLPLLSVNDPWERVKNIGMFYVKFAIENPELYDLMFVMDIMGDSQNVLQVERELQYGFKLFNFLLQNIIDCIEAGYLPKSDPEIAAVSLWSFAHGLSSLAIKKRFIMFSEERIESVIKQAFEYIFDNIRK